MIIRGQRLWQKILFRKSFYIVAERDISTLQLKPPLLDFLGQFGAADEAEKQLATDILSPYKVLVANLIANSCLFAYSAVRSIHLDSCFFGKL